MAQVIHNAEKKNIEPIPNRYERIWPNGSHCHNFTEAICFGVQSSSPNIFGILFCNSVSSGQQLPIAAKAPLIYPNPVSEVLFVTTSESERLSDMAIINTEGKVVFSKTNFSSSGININVSDLPKGVYILKMNQEGSLLPLFRKVLVK